MSFQQGLSGLTASSKNLEVIGNNIANANTYGSKASRAEFSDMYATALNGAGGSQIGIGVNLETVAQQFTQGNISTTENPMDLAINGAGFFQVKDTQGQLLYTRNGQFKVDRDGYVVNGGGDKLLGYAADAAGVVQSGQAVPLRMPTGGLAPVATSKIDMEVNLDSGAAVKTPASSPLIDFNDSSTYNYSTSNTVYDANGQAVSLKYFFQKSASDNWNVYASANGTPLALDGSNNPAASATLTFNGANAGPTVSPSPLVVDIPSTTNTNGGTTLAITGVTIDVSSMRQTGSKSGTTDLSQNGYAPGQLTGINFEDNGTVTARYSNGQTKPAGQIEIANFRNPQGLQSLGGNLWTRTYASGEPVVGTPTDGNLGSLQAGALEESNVDLTGELVNMITAQRVYQANAQTIKTQDQLLQTLVNLR